VTGNSTHIQGGHLQEGSKTGLVGRGLRPPRDSMRTTLLSQSWQPGRLMSIAGPMKSQIGELVPSTLARHSTPCELGDTSARRGYDSKLANGPISIQICISWCMPTLIPTCQLRMSLNEGRVSCNGDGGRWGYFPLLFFLFVTGFRFRGGILPSRPCLHLGGTPSLPSLFLCPQLLITGTVTPCGTR
jgi:hypothetical protein